VSDRFNVYSQYVLPKHALTAFAGRVASRERGRVTTGLIRWFVGKYGVDMDEAANSDIQSYRSFNDFFTRALKPGARPLAQADLISPVDGAISQFGTINDDQIFQAKGHLYSTTAMVGGDSKLAAQFQHGSYATLYLSPKDYHRIHMPCDGQLRRMIYVPGALFSVNPATARGVPGLFARNERVVCVFDTARGPFVLALVGATIVGSMATVWHGVVNRSRQGAVREWDYPAHEGEKSVEIDLIGHSSEREPSAQQPVMLKQGDEMGRFLLGSTVVMLFPKGDLQFNASWQPGKSIRFGEAMAKYPSASK
jgi:phosphatidylserine decarboxylase